MAKRPEIALEIDCGRDLEESDIRQIARAIARLIYENSHQSRESGVDCNIAECSPKGQVQ